jgi:hypothetical protein
MGQIGVSQGYIFAANHEKDQKEKNRAALKMRK